MISSGIAFFLVFTALYLLESVTLCPGSTVVFYNGLTGAVKFRFTKSLPEFGKGRLFMASPFFPGASLYVTGALPLLFSNKGFFPVPGNGAGEPCRLFYSYDRVKSVGVRQNAVTVDDKVLCETRSEHEALWWKERLLSLARAGSGDREPEALRIIDEIFSVKQAETFIIAAGRETLILKVMVNCLFVYCFFIVPAVSWMLSIAATWNLLLGLFIIMTAAAVTAFIYSYKKVFPSRGVPWSKVVSMVLYTPSLLRCMDIINKTSLAVYHPAAVARVFDNRNMLRELLSYYFREYTIAPMPQADAQASEIISWFRKHAAERILAAAEESGITRDELLAPPERKDEEVRTYCPLCHEQYVLDSGTCIECGTKLEGY